MAANKKPILSIGIIMKDEIRCIERCMKSLMPLRDALPCELVIADTGSTDGSREVAAEYADILFDFPWVDDFAAARNAVMEKCSGKWYMSVDADEYLDPDIKEIVAYFKGKEIALKNTGFYNIRNYTSHDTQNSDYTDFNAHRLIKMSTGVRYDGIIHERFSFANINAKPFFLLNTTFHHDGYVRTTEEEITTMKAKSARNMVLLRKKLEESTDDMTYLQCIESSSVSKDQLEFAKKALNAARERDFAPAVANGESILNVLLCRAVSVLLLQQDDTAEDELLMLSNRLTNFLMFDLDVSFAAISYFIKKKNWESVISYAEKFEVAYERYQTEVKTSHEFIISPAFYGYNKNKQQGKLLKADALINLGKEDNALDLLETTDFIPLCYASNDIGMALRLLIELRSHQRACTIFKTLYETVNSLENNAEIAKKIINGFFINAIKNSEEKDNYRLMGECDGLFGFCAKILSTNSPDAIESICSGYNEIATLPSEILYKIINITQNLPQNFYKSPAMWHLSAASSLSSIPNFAQTLIRFVCKNNFHNDIEKTNFVYHCASTLVQRGDIDKTDYDIICRMFLMFSDHIMNNIYSEELLNNSDLWNFCITNHHLSLIIMKVRDLVLEGDEIGIITTLKTALDVTPTAKHIASYLIDNATRLFAKPPLELMGLADKLKTMLAIYKNDDPFAVEIKNSDAYKQIAYLVEIPTKEELGL